MKQKFKNAFYEIKKAWKVLGAIGYVFVWPAWLILGFIIWCKDIINGLNS